MFSVGFLYSVPGAAYALPWGGYGRGVQAGISGLNIRKIEKENTEISLTYDYIRAMMYHRKGDTHEIEQSRAPDYERYRCWHKHTR